MSLSVIRPHLNFHLSCCHRREGLALRALVMPHFPSTHSPGDQIFYL
jgi:hypothetical protein